MKKPSLRLPVGAQPANSGPVTVALPNTTNEKMAAIVELAKATHYLSRALESVNTSVTISQCTVNNSDGPAFSVEAV